LNEWIGGLVDWWIDCIGKLVELVDWWIGGVEAGSLGAGRPEACAEWQLASWGSKV